MVAKTHEKKAKILLIEANRARVKAALLEAQNGCRVRCINADTVYTWMRRIEETYAIIPMRAQRGITVTVNPAHERMPGAYRGIPMATHFVVERRPDGWALTEIYRTSAETPQSVAVLPAEAQAAIVRVYTRID